MLDRDGKVDLRIACADLESGGATNDFAKIRELLRILEGIVYPDDTDEEGHKKQLKTLQDGIWDQVVTFVEANHHLLTGVAETIALKGSELETPFGMTESELKAIPLIRDWFVAHPSAAVV